MTVHLSGHDLARRLAEAVPGSIEGASAAEVWVKPEALLQVMRWLKEAPGLDFAYLSSVTAVDYVERFELVYHLTSLRHNHSAVVKARVYGREAPAVPSLTGLWQGADLQEREVWDLMGVAFQGHPNLKRIMLWEGFPGHPLRRDHQEDPFPYAWPHGG